LYCPLESGISKQVYRHTSQEVCPWNRRFAATSSEPLYATDSGSGTDGPALVELMGPSEEEFAFWFSGTSIKRAKRRGPLRNAAVALGNWGSREVEGKIEEALMGE